MIYMYIVGGWGNQLFQYAIAYSLSQKTNSKLVLDISAYQRKNRGDFLLTNTFVKADTINYLNTDRVIDRAFINDLRRRLAIGLKTKFYKEKNIYEFDQSIFELKGDYYIMGWFQNEKYFIDYKDEILRLYRPIFKINENIMALMREMKSSNSVAVHMRRGDYVKLGWSLDVRYYERAIDKMMEIYGNDISLYVFSDDIEFARKYFCERYKCLFVKIIDIDADKDTKDLNEFYLMSTCKNQIIANSSYSWWAAYLNENGDKRIIAPLSKPFKREKYPSNWITIDMN